VRIVVTSSGASEAAPPINFENIQGLSTFSTGLAECIAKLANVMHAPELATRLANKGIALHIAAPGPLASRLFENASQEIRDHVRDMTVQGIQNEKSSGPHLGA
jgi:NAD(P)-dependent dehydrogenase (short-subunit alcohol dehydrogenase family)